MSASNDRHTMESDTVSTLSPTPAVPPALPTTPPPSPLQPLKTLDKPTHFTESTTEQLTYAQPGSGLAAGGEEREEGEQRGDDAGATKASHSQERQEEHAREQSEAEEHVDKLTKGLAGMILTGPAALYEAVAPTVATNLHSASGFATRTTHDLTNKLTTQGLRDTSHQQAASLGGGAQEVTSDKEQATSSASGPKDGFERIVEVVRSYLPTSLGGSHDTAEAPTSTPAHDVELSHKESPSTPPASIAPVPLDKIDAVVPTALHELRDHVKETRDEPAIEAGEITIAKPLLVSESLSAAPAFLAETTNIARHPSIFPQHTVNPLSNAAFDPPSPTTALEKASRKMSAEDALSDTSFVISEF